MSDQKHDKLEIYLLDNFGLLYTYINDLQTRCLVCRTRGRFALSRFTPSLTRSYPTRWLIRTRPEIISGR